MKEQNLRACPQGAGTSFQGGHDARQPQMEAGLIKAFTS